MTEYHEDDMEPQKVAPDKKFSGDVWKYVAIGAAIVAIVFSLLRHSPQTDVPGLKQAQETVKEPTESRNGRGYGLLNGVRGD